MKRSKVILMGGAVLAVLGMLLSYLYTAGASTGSSEKPASSGATAPATTSDLTVGTTWEDLATLVEKRNVPASLRPRAAGLAGADYKRIRRLEGESNHAPNLFKLHPLASKVKHPAYASDEPSIMPEVTAEDDAFEGEGPIVSRALGKGPKRSKRQAPIPT
jgi:hypothetical protein